jgi:signal transduction histidine kinase
LNSPDDATPNPQFSFHASARLQRYLGRELIGDPNLAVIEYVKNGYDAGAREVRVEFRTNNRPLAKQQIFVSDNGSGMTKTEFEENWMRPGYSGKAKALETQTEYKPAKGRIPSGEKGLGRLAGGRLGNILHVYTRASTSDPWLHAVIRWADFEDMDLDLEQVGIDYEFLSDYDSPFSIGTVIVIEELTLDWAGKMPGRKVPGRSDVRFGRLKEDLDLLVMPLRFAGQQFTVHLSGDDPAVAAFVGEAGESQIEALDYYLRVWVRDDDHVPTARWMLHRGSDFASDRGLARCTRGSSLLKSGGTTPLMTGPFQIRLYYYPSQAAGKRFREMGIPPGVFLYRDGVRVEPYGDPADDWLGLQARKASRQGHAPIQPNRLIGFVSISRISNPQLVDMTNRLGLLDNAEFTELVRISQVLITLFENFVLDEFVERNWESPEIKLKRAAERVQRFREGFARVFLHSLRQPLVALSADISTMRRIVGRLSAEEQEIERAGRVLDRAELHLATIDQGLRRFMSVDRDPLGESLRELQIADVLETVQRRVDAFAATHEVKLRVARGVEGTVFFEEQTLIEALVELADNAVKAASGRENAEVLIDAKRHHGKGIGFIVQDNGLGMPREIADTLFKRPVSTTGATGFGLLYIKEALAIYGGTCTLVSTGAKGSVFEILIPTAGVL